MGDSKMKERTIKIADSFFGRHRELQFMKEDILQACNLVLEAYRKGGKLLICGNGGSCADSDHIVGELMKGFLLKRPLDAALKDKFYRYFGETGREVAEKLQGSLPAISLSVHTSFNTAFINDVDAVTNYAQQVIGYAKPEDVLIGISTSGNAENVYYAFMAAKVKGIKCIGISGRDGGKLASIPDCCLVVPADETYQIQEYHLAIYHFICSFVESEMFQR
jgi:D-sedoheptulose 7-phosphate isomerase